MPPLLHNTGRRPLSHADHVEHQQWTGSTAEGRLFKAFVSLTEDGLKPTPEANPLALLARRTHSLVGIVSLHRAGSKLYNLPASSGSAVPSASLIEIAEHFRHRCAANRALLEIVTCSTCELVDTQNPRNSANPTFSIYKCLNIPPVHPTLLQVGIQIRNHPLFVGGTVRCGSTNGRRHQSPLRSLPRLPARLRSQQ